jgi:hypothetical protein
MQHPHAAVWQYAWYIHIIGYSLVGAFLIITCFVMCCMASGK